MKDTSPEDVDEMSRVDFDGGIVNANDADKEPHEPVEVGNRMFNEGPDFLIV